jgi:hypothetical protein
MAVRLAADADHLYFKTGEAQGGRLVVVDKATGTSRNLATGAMSTGMVAIDADSINWGTDENAMTTIHAIKKDGTERGAVDGVRRDGHGRDGERLGDGRAAVTHCSVTTSSVHCAMWFELWTSWNGRQNAA